MDGSKLILTSPVTPPTVLNVEGLQSDSKKIEQLSKDFESVLMTKLVDTMKDTVEQWQGEKEDAAGGQVQGLFWYYLAQDMADKGGVGLWKDLYRFFTDMQKTNATSQSLDEGL